jgi:hypothetical protein
MHEKKTHKRATQKIVGNETHTNHLDSYPGKGLGDGDAAPAALVSASPPRAGRETPEVTEIGGTKSSGVGGATTWYLPQQKQNKGPKQM